MSEDEMDPISAAGAVLGAADKSKLTERLLGRSLSAVGDLWGEWTEEWADRQRAKRQANARAHLEAVAEINGHAWNEQLGDGEEFVSWVKGAAKVDPADEALSDVWRAALLLLQSDDVTRLRMLRIAERLSPDEAAAFLILTKGIPSSYRVRRSWQRGYQSELASLRLIEPHVNAWLNPLAQWLGVIMVVSFLALGVLYVTGYLPKLPQGLRSWSIPAPTLLILIASAVVSMVVVDQSPITLTKDGEILIDALRRAKLGASKTQDFPGA